MAHIVDENPGPVEVPHHHFGNPEGADFRELD